MDWTYNLLWNKSKVSALTAHEQDKETYFFPLWCSIALETLSRATLAFVHPALLADPSKGSNILYVFGFYNEKDPAKSIPIKTVFDRLTKIVELFTSKDSDICMNFMERRNRELHSGAAAFEDYPTKIWLADFYRTCNILIGFQKRKMKDWLPNDDAKIALEMIKKDHNKVIHKVKLLIAKHRDNFYKKPKLIQKKLRDKAEKSHMHAGFPVTKSYSSKILCLACKSDGLISGGIARANEPHLDGDYIVRQISILPTKFHCLACELKLSGYDQLQAAEVGGYINIEEVYDPKEYYEFDQSDLYEEDYGND